MEHGLAAFALRNILNRLNPYEAFCRFLESSMFYLGIGIVLVCFGAVDLVLHVTRYGIISDCGEVFGLAIILLCAVACNKPLSFLVPEQFELAVGVVSICAIGASWDGVLKFGLATNFTTIGSGIMFGLGLVFLAVFLRYRGWEQARKRKWR